jgi:hypothetical protein
VKITLNTTHEIQLLHSETAIHTPEFIMGRMESNAVDYEESNFGHISQSKRCFILNSMLFFREYLYPILSISCSIFFCNHIKARSKRSRSTPRLKRGNVDPLPSTASLIIDRDELYITSYLKDIY